MERKDKYLLIEFFLTFLLLLALTFLFGESVATYRAYLSAGLAAGFVFSWFYRNGQNAYARYAVNAAVVGVFIWVLVALTRSSFFYSEVLTIFIQGGILLEIALSFDASSPSSLAYLQALSFPLLLCFPAFVKKYDAAHITFVLAYLVIWAAILKVKFYESFIPSKKNDLSKFYAFVLSIAVFMLVLFISWQTFRHVLMGKIDKGGFLVDEGEQTRIKEGAREKEFYTTQDALQEKISRWIPEMDSKEDRHQMLYMLSQLTKDSSDVMELKKAEKGLIDKLRRLGPGLEPGQTDDITITMEKYMNEKIAMESKRSRGNIMNSLKNNPFRIEERMAIADRLSRMQDGNTFKEVNEQEKQANNIINKSSVSSRAKKELNDLFREAKGLKELELYRKRLHDFKKKTGSLGGEAGEEFQELYSAIDNADRLSDFQGVRKKLEEMKKGGGDKERKDLIEQAGELLKLKSEMFTLRASNRLKEKMDDSGLPGSVIQEIKAQSDKTASSRNQEEFKREDSKLREDINESGAAVHREADELAGAKVEEFIREAKEKIGELLKDTVLPDSGKELLDGLNKMESRKDTERLDADHSQIKERLAKYYKDGFVSKDTKDALASEIDGIKELLEFKLKEGKQQGKPGEKISRQQQGDYQQELKDSIDNSSLKKERKEDLQRLADTLFNAGSLEQIDNVKEGAKRQIDNCLREGADKNEINSIREKFDAALDIQRMFLIDAAFSDIMQKTDDLEKRDQERAEKIRDQIDKVRESATPEEFRKELDKLKEYLNAQQQASFEKQKNEKQEQREEIENIRRKISKIEESITLEEFREELDKLKDYLDARQQASLEKQQQMLDQGDSDNIKEKLNRVKESDTLEESRKELDKLDDYLSSRSVSTSEYAEKKPEASSPWQVHILPSRLVLSVGSSASLKAVAVYQNSLIREVNNELEWSSSNPNVVGVDRNGSVSAIAPGKAKLIATYKDNDSRSVQVSVVERADFEIEDTVKRELGALADR